MTRAEELAAIDSAIAAGFLTRYPMGHSSGQAETVNRIFGKPAQWVLDRANTPKSRRKSLVKRAEGRAKKAKTR